MTSKDISVDLKDYLCLDVDASTIRKNLIINDYKSYVAKRKPALTRLQKKKRLDWCKKYGSKDIDFLKKVIFSDESTFCIQSNAANRRIRRKLSEDAYL